MTQTRIYVPLTAAGVRRLAADRQIGSGSLRAFAVTGRVERADPTGDEEEWEYAALTESVEAATAARGSQERRVIAAADVDPTWVQEQGDTPASVQISSPVPLSRVVSFHVDESPGDEGMDDLLWYDATELEEVLRLL
ncbi:hypothetical protein [Nostocoides sp. HKS02]|uniref:DUF6912 family protein n=1 Tax=Nostocoides sp. HKS02 TaxID=1813880 RepID=UPI0012B48686|nr:hypothetical protein [Tetrasphaera sp. HKS02]QGN56722.1 hypothetical protein GKE56_01075 [Tetrasphaera sp. HKS02]